MLLPTYNEQENITEIVAAIHHQLVQSIPGGRVLIIDDNSPDGTGITADKLAEQYQEVEVLHRQQCDGLGAAYLAGFAYALEHGATHVFEMDADFSHNPNDLARLFEQTKDADLVLGSRYVSGGKIVGWNWLRRCISAGGCWYARNILRVNIKDLTGGFKCFKRTVLENIELDTITSRGYAFQIELTYRALRHGFHIKEIPITFQDRERGKSKMSWRIAREAAWVVPRLRRYAAKASQQNFKKLPAN